MYRHYVTWISDNFGPRQISVIAVRGTFAFWHTDISSFQSKLAESAWDQNLRREWCVASAPEVSEEQKGQNTSSTWTLWMGTWSIIITRCIEFRVSILTTPFLRGADSSHIFLVILTPNTPRAKDTMTGWTVQHIKKDRFVLEKKADRNFKRTFHFRILWPSSTYDFGGLLCWC